MKKLARILSVVCLVIGATGLAHAASEDDVNGAIDFNLGDHALYETSIKAFQQAVASGDKADVAAFVRYPIAVTINGRKRTITSSTAFLRAYDQIMTPDIIDAVKNQKYEDLFVNYQGVMFGDGEVWMNGICLDRHCKHVVPKVVTIQHTD